MICTHLDTIQNVSPRTQGCEECLKIGDIWVELRMCLSCGHVGCCNSSKNKHAQKHFNEIKHPIIQSIESNSPWRWCYIDNVYLD